MPLRHVVFSPDGKWLVAAGGTVNMLESEGIAKAWETKTWKLHDTLKDGFTSYVDNIFFVSPEIVATVSAKIRRRSFFDSSDPTDGTMVRYWSIPEKKELEPLHLKKAGEGRFIGFHIKEKLVAFYDYTPRVCGVFSIPKLEETVLLKDCPAALLQFSPTGERIFAAIGGAHDPQVRLHDTRTGKCLGMYKLAASNDNVDPTNVRAGRVSPDGKMLGVSTYWPGKIYVLQADLSAALWVFDAPIVNDCIDFSPDSKMLAIKQGRDTVQLYSIKTKEPTQKFDANPEGVNGWCFSPDGAWIAIASGGHPEKNGGTSPGRVRVFEVKTGKLVAELE